MTKYTSRQLKKLDWHRGMLSLDDCYDFGFGLCCVDFFHNVWCTSIRADIPEYAQTMSELTDNRGLVLCPNCLIDRLTEFCVAP